MSGKTRTRSWKPSHLRIVVALVFCLTALALGSFRISESAGAAGSRNAPKQQPAVQAPAKAAPRASAALEKLRPRATAAISSHVARESGNYDFVRANDGAGAFLFFNDRQSLSSEERGRRLRGEPSASRC